MEFKDRIRELRTTTNVSATDLAARLGKSVSAIRMWETGKAKPDADTLLKLTDFFQVSTDYLLGRDERKTLEDEKAKRRVPEDDEVSAQKKLEGILLHIIEDAVHFDNLPGIAVVAHELIELWKLPGVTEVNDK